ncbi:MAG: Gfo/Idh/MocA family oxidoreductase, partial [Lentisphaerae bacterium]|nr:Gfo/Idh/MocA family oxidoreductase [Lentisphaerota bacterium]
ICTPPHWHGLMSVMAAQAGKDIWCEKPMTRTIGEGRRVQEAVKANGRIFRLNTWFRFMSGFYGFGTEVKPLKKLMENRVLGWPVKAVVGSVTGFSLKFGWSGLVNLKPEPVPSTFDYDLWLGPAPYKPYHPHRTHGTFRGYWDYDGGGLGDMGQHYLDPVQYLMEKDETSPIKIEVDCPPQHPDAVGSFRRITFTYADGCQIILDGDDSMKGAPFLEGPKGKVWPKMKSDIPNLESLLAELPEPAPQQTDFVESVKLRRPFALNEGNGFRSATIVNLGIVAMRLGRGFAFDPVALTAVNDPAADRFIYQQMRAPWLM